MYLKLSFQQGVTRLHLIKKLIIGPFFAWAPGLPVTRGTLKNGATKKNFVQVILGKTQRNLISTSSSIMRHF